MMAELKRKEEAAPADLNVPEEQNPMGRKGPDSANLARPRLVRDEGPDVRTRGDELADAGTQPVPVQDSRASSHLFSDSDIGDLRARWSTVQAGFVDEPRRAVEQADKLVAAVMQRLTEGFSNERSTLEKQWDQGGDVSTEDLRIALQRYRTFFDRLLNA